MRTTSVLVALVAVALGGYALGASCAGGTDAAAIARADSLRLALAAMEIRHSRIANEDSARADSIRLSALQIARLRERKPLTVYRTDSLVLAVADTALRDSLTAALLTERAVSDSVANANSAIIRLLTESRKVAWAERDSYRELSHELNRQLQAAVHRPQRGRVRPCGFAGLGVSGATAGVGVCLSL